MYKQIKLFAHFNVILSLSAGLIFNQAAAEISIGQFLSKTNQTIGSSSPVISVLANNTGSQTKKDIHIGVISPSGQIFEYPDWNQQLKPWLSDFTIPANFALENTKITDLSGVPGGLTPGIWQTFFALTDPGTLNITAIEFTQLNVLADNNNANSSSGNRFGSVNISHVQSLNTFTSIGASASFYQAENNLPEFIESIQTETPDIDQCNFTELPIGTATIVNNDLISFDLDAGDITLSSNGNSLALTKDIQADSINYFNTLTESVFETAQNFSFTGSGGSDVGSFQVTLPSLAVLKLLSPATDSILEVDPDQDFSIRWEGSNSSQEITVQLVSTRIDLNNPENSEAAYIYCRFVDDGNGVIKRELIQQLAQFSANNPIELPEGLEGLDIPELENLINTQTLGFVISRNDSVFFNTSAPDLDYAIALIGSHVSLTGQFK